MIEGYARNLWVDYAKAIGIILVVYGHVARGLHSAGLPMDEGLFQLVDSVIYSFHMPLFFFLSGLFFHGSLTRYGGARLVRNKADTILYPYVVWSLLQGGMEVVLSRYTNGNVSLGEVLALAWAPRAQFWFLYALFFVFMLCAVVYARARRSLFLPLALMFASVYLAAQMLPPVRILGYLAANTVFFALGIWFNEVKDDFQRHCAWLAPALGVLFVVGQYLFHITFGLTYELGGWPVLVLATLSILFIVALCMCGGRLGLRLVLMLGSSSMSIYLMHILAGSGTRVILSKFLGADSVALHLLLGTLVGLLAPLLAEVVIRRLNLDFLLAPPKWRLLRRKQAANAGQYE